MQSSYDPCRIVTTTVSQTTLETRRGRVELKFSRFKVAVLIFRGTHEMTGVLPIPLYAATAVGAVAPDLSTFWW
jgi:hypothetical protein